MIDESGAPVAVVEQWVARWGKHKEGHGIELLLGLKPASGNQYYVKQALQKLAAAEHKKSLYFRIDGDYFWKRTAQAAPQSGIPGGSRMVNVVRATMFPIYMLPKSTYASAEFRLKTASNVKTAATWLPAVQVVLVVQLGCGTKSTKSAISKGGWGEWRGGRGQADVCDGLRRSMPENLGPAAARRAACRSPLHGAAPTHWTGIVGVRALRRFLLGVDCCPSHWA